MGINKHYEGLIYEQYRPVRRCDLPKDGSTVFCLWCDYPISKKNQILWCSKECEKEYLERAKMEELRFAVQERDISNCENCGKFDPQYMIVPRFPVAQGGGSTGIDGVRTLCEQCFLSRAGEISPEEAARLEIPDIPALRNAWRSSERRWRDLRYALGPVLVSGVRWHRILLEYQGGLRHLAKAAAERTREHFRLVQSHLRWWKIIRKNSKKAHSLLAQTITSLEHQERACTIWSVHFRSRNFGALR